MKKLIVAVILAVVLTLTLATPAFAWGPPDSPDLPEPGKEGVGHAYDSLIWPGSYGIGKGFRTSGAGCVPPTPASHGRFYGNTCALHFLEILLGL